MGGTLGQVDEKIEKTFTDSINYEDKKAERVKDGLKGLLTDTNTEIKRLNDHKKNLEKQAHDDYKKQDQLALLEFERKKASNKIAYESRLDDIQNNHNIEIASQETTKKVLEDEVDRITKAKKQFLIPARAHRVIAKHGLRLFA